MQLTQYMDTRREMVDEALADFLQERYGGSDFLHMTASMVAQGKRLRGIMSLLTCEAVSGEPDKALIAACAVELCQAASLVKDDVCDNDEVRRGGMAFWKEKSAIMADRKSVV